MTDQLLAEFLAPEPSADPTPEALAVIERALRDFRSEDFAIREQASAAVLRIGLAALPAMRRASEDSDLEVSERALLAVRQIEEAAREAIAARAAALGAPAAARLQARLDEANRAWARLAMDAPRAEREGRQDEMERIASEMESASGRAASIKRLMSMAGLAASERS